MDTRNELGHGLPKDPVVGAHAPASPRESVAASPPSANPLTAEASKPPKRGVRFSSDRTRLELSMTSGLSPRMIVDLALMDEGTVLARLAEGAGSGRIPIAAAELEPRAVVDEAQPRAPVEELVLRSVVLVRASASSAE